MTVPAITPSAAGHGLLRSFSPVPSSATLPLDRRGRLRNGARPGDFLAAPRCGARTRCGAACRQPAMANGRCRLHGGLSTGPRTPEGRARCAQARRTSTAPIPPLPAPCWQKPAPIWAASAGSSAGRPPLGMGPSFTFADERAQGRRIKGSPQRTQRSQSHEFRHDARSAPSSFLCALCVLCGEPFSRWAWAPSFGFEAGRLCACADRARDGAEPARQPPACGHRALRWAWGPSYGSGA
jgi:hypothetical protein